MSVRPYPEKRNHHSFVNISPTLVIDTSMEKSSRVLQHLNTKIWIFFKNVWNWILTCAKSWNHLNFVNISLTLVIDTSMERSSLVAIPTTTWKPKNLIHLKKNWNWILICSYFDLCQRAEIVQVGLSRNLYDDIGDASLSLRGSTSSFEFRNHFFELGTVFYSNNSGVGFMQARGGGEVFVLNNTRSSLEITSNMWINYP